MSNGDDVKIDPPYRLDPLQNIINVKWKKPVYLVIQIFGGNQRSGAPGPNPISSVDPPIVKVTSATDPKTGKNINILMDEKHTPLSNDGCQCMTYDPPQTAFIGFQPITSIPGPPPTLWSYPIFGDAGEDPQAAYDFKAGGGPSPYINIHASAGDGTWECPALVPPDDQFGIAGESGVIAGVPYDVTWYLQLAVIPVNYSSSRTIADDYLYKIKEGDDVISVAMSAILENKDGPPIDEGGASMYVSVYSTAQEDITKLSQLIDYDGDGIPRLDPDDTRSILQVTSDNQGTFKISVHKDTNKADQQTDNYGKLFQPYKVTFDPSKDSVEEIPDQPPQLLPPPKKKAS